MKQLLIVGLTEANCSLCLDADGRKSSKPIFVVGSEGMTWTVCGPHLGALVKASSGEKSPAAVSPSQARPANANPVPAVPVGNNQK